MGCDRIRTLLTRKYMLSRVSTLEREGKMKLHPQTKPKTIRIATLTVKRLTLTLNAKIQSKGLFFKYEHR